MACPFARFVVHYKDGTTVIENRKDSHHWDNLPKEGIRAVGILMEPVPLWDDPWETLRDRKVSVMDRHGRTIRVSPIQHTLKGSQQYNHQFFQFKTAVQPIGIRKGLPVPTQYHVNLTVGMVVDNEGHCIVMEAKEDRSVYTYYTTVYSMGLNLDLFNIKLGQ